ncbi:MAG: TfoX/Sxy family protein [Pseudomonadota bacterium]|nr:TfoX/Sxy family protein [Pseudomonadota bacterium]
MTSNDDLAERIRRLLVRHLPDGATLQDISEKKMFGGLAFMVRGKMCVAIGGRDACEVMLRIGKAHHDEALTHEGVRTTVMKGREYRGYIDLDETALPQLEHWVMQALAHNQELTATPPKRPPGSARRAKKSTP